MNRVIGSRYSVIGNRWPVFGDGVLAVIRCFRSIAARPPITGHRLPATLLFALIALPTGIAAQDVENGKVIYDKWCAGCHGDTGAGDGEAAGYMLPQPRDFTGAVYQIRTTASGELPTDDDMRRVIDDGMPGSTMPAWRSKLGSGDRDDVIAYIKTFSRFFDGTVPEPIELGRRPGNPSDEDLAEGRVLFEDELQCLRCHGNMGRGDGTSAAELTDDLGFPDSRGRLDATLDLQRRRHG